jgi:predicted negative regulator of RcsB-dependent stress response
MSTYDLEEQEQLDTLKSWWKQNANLVLTALTVALAAFAAWNAWNWYRDRQALDAASLYEVLEKAARANDIKAAREVGESLLEKYPGTSYGTLAALVTAKLNYQSGDAKTAKAQLQWVLENARSDELKAVARLRLAHVLLDEGAPEEALKAVSASPPPGFEALFDSLRGDIYLVQKKGAEARAAYRAALEKADKKDLAMRQLLQLKIDALGEG